MNNIKDILLKNNAFKYNVYMEPEAPFGGGGVRGWQMPTPDFPGGPSFHHKGLFAGHNNPFCSIDLKLLHAY